MYSKASIKGHPIHPILVGFPITFYVLTFVGLCVYNFTSADLFWYRLAFFSNMAAIATALVAAVPGFIDWAVGVPNKTEAKKDGLIHMTLNLLTLAIFIGNGLMMNGTWDQPMNSLGSSIILTGVGCVLLMGAGYYGWTMVGIHKVGVSMSPEQEDIQERYENKRPEEPPVVFH